jgi:aspartate/methionine/tyrosine aminotransferase
VPEGTYFILADCASWGFDNDVDFCRYLTTEVGVGAIPPSAFYSDAHKGLARTLVRFCFCKTGEILSQAAEKIEQAYRARIGRNVLTPG